MRCLYCGKQLALFKKLTGSGEFCSDAHKQSYHEEYNKLALNRLMEAQTRQEDKAPKQPAGSASLPAEPEQPAFAEPGTWGKYFRQPVETRAPGSGEAAKASLVAESSEWPVRLPSAGELGFAPSPAQHGLIMEHRPATGAPVILNPAPAFLRTDADAPLALPEWSFEIARTTTPTAAGPVVYEPQPLPAPEAELICQPAAGFEFHWDLPEGLDLDWVRGIGETRSEPESSSYLEVEVEEEVVPDEVAPVRGGRPIIDPETPEPVIDDALLVSLFGSDDASPKAPEQPPPPASVAPEPEPEPVVQTVEAPVEAPAESKEASLPDKPAAPREAGSFLPVTIRPAAPPSRTRLMQTFQAISLVSANPQIPVWNAVPLRPKMGIGRGPGPGARMVDRGKADGDSAVAKAAGGAAVEVAEAPDPTQDLDVPTFGLTNRQKSGLSRWFKLGILVGVLGIAGGAFEQGNECAAATHPNRTTEFAECRN